MFNGRIETPAVCRFRPNRFSPVVGLPGSELLRDHLRPPL